MVRLLLDSGAQTDLSNLGGGLLANAAFEGRTDIAQILISEYNLPPEEKEPNRYCPALAAIHRGHIETLEFLLSQGALIPEDAIFSAAQEGHQDMVKFLADRNVDPDIRVATETALHRAAQLENTAMVQTLISIGADVNAKSRGWTALHYAAVMGNLEIAQLLIAAGADVNAGLKRGDPPLRVAGLWRYDAIVELLIRNGARG